MLFSEPFSLGATIFSFGETSLKQLLDFMRKKKETQEMEAKKKQQLLDFLRKKKETQEMEAKKKEQEAEDEEEQQGKEIDDGSEEEVQHLQQNTY